MRFPKISRSNLLFFTGGWTFLFSLIMVSCTFNNKETGHTKSQLPKVMSAYPSNDTLPDNLLRFYVQFSHSMKTVNNLEHIKLLNDQGEEVSGAIFNNVYELWDEEQKQLTLILDPARVKTGLLANKQYGRALVPGKCYTLVIEKAENIHGDLIKEPYVKKFFVTLSDTIAPDVAKWKVVPPASQSVSAVKIIFPEMLDRLSLLTRIRIVDANHTPVEGDMVITQQEKEWHFMPVRPWRAEEYYIQVNGRLEDPCGNNLNGLFEHAIGSLKQEGEGGLYERSFTPE